MRTVSGCVLAIAALSLFGSAAAWSASPPATTQSAEPSEAVLKAGRSVYEQWCLTCHGEGRFMAGTNGLRAKYQGQRPAVLDERTDLTLETVRFFVRNGVGIMAPFRKTEITDAELDSLATYLSRDRSP